METNMSSLTFHISPIFKPMALFQKLFDTILVDYFYIGFFETFENIGITILLKTHV